MGPLLSVLDVRKHYEVRRTLVSVARETIRAVDGVSFHVGVGETLGVVGESGSGKSTLARCVLLLERPDSGEIVFDGVNLLTAGNQEVKRLRRRMQIIFQDPYSSLNPRMKVREIIAEPVRFHGMAKGKADVEARVGEILKSVGLDEDFLKKYPHEMSGGQRQRVAIGRALATEPALVIADEPVSSLDVSIQAQIVNLFLDEVFLHPLHPYTRMLIRASQGDFALKEEGTNNAEPLGCPYYEKCEDRKRECAASVPELTGDGDHRVACFQAS